MNWPYAREIARVPSMDRGGSQALLWGDGSGFAVLWAPEGKYLARVVKDRGKPLRIAAYKKTLARCRDAGEPIVAAFEAEKTALSLDQLAALIGNKGVSWETFRAWKYYGIGGDSGDDASCRFELQLRDPAKSAQVNKVYRALHGHLPPEQWRQLLPLFPTDATRALKADAKRRTWARPVILLIVALMVAGAVWMVVKSLTAALG